MHAVPILGVSEDRLKLDYGDLNRAPRKSETRSTELPSGLTLWDNVPCTCHNVFSIAGAHSVDPFHSPQLDVYKVQVQVQSTRFRLGALVGL